jgi:hypothetical protein
MSERTYWKRRLNDVRAQASAPTLVSDLRIIDIGVWMYHAKHATKHTAKHCASIA